MVESNLNNNLTPLASFPAPMKSLTSSNLSSMAYDLNTGTLRIVFNAGGTYDYFKVPSTVVHELEQATSAGSYFHRFIREKYKFKRVS